jgi:hypothetical protein
MLLAFLRPGHRKQACPDVFDACSWLVLVCRNLSPVLLQLSFKGRSLGLLVTDKRCHTLSAAAAAAFVVLYVVIADLQCAKPKGASDAASTAGLTQTARTVAPFIAAAARPFLTSSIVL